MGPLSMLLLVVFVGAPVTLVPSDDMIRLRDGSGSIRLIVRNRSTRTLYDLRLKLEPNSPLKVRVQPQQIARCQPADRCVFQVVVEKEDKTPERRFLSTVRLSSRGQANILKRLLYVDAGPRASKNERGWMPAGTIQVGSRSRTSRVLVLTLLSTVPVALLLLLGWWFKRKTRQEKRSDAG